MVKRNIGSQRLFDHYLLFMIERHIMKYTLEEYTRMIRAMADKGFVEDFVFWDKYVKRYIFWDPKLDGEKEFSSVQAKRLWDTFVYLKLKCPMIEIKDVLSQLEKFIEVDRIEAKQ